MCETLMSLLKPEIDGLISAGRKEERLEGIRNAVRALRGFGHSDAEIRRALQEYFSLSKEEDALLKKMLK